MITQRLKLLPIIVLFILGGCGTAPKTPGTSTPQEPMVDEQLSEIGLLLLQAESATPLVRAQYTLQAAEELFTINQIERSSRLLDNLNIGALPASSEQLYWLLRAQIANVQQQPELMLQYLDQILQPTLLSAQQQALLSHMVVNGQTLLGDYSGMLAQLIESSALSPENDRQPIHNRIWLLLKEYTLQDLTDLAATPDNTYLAQGWYDLALSLRTAGFDVIRGLQSIREWQQLWSQHPAARSLPEAISELVEQNTKRPKHIAILLPQTGSLDKAAKAIIEGILAAHYEDQSLGFPVPKISFYNSDKIDNLFDFYLDATYAKVDLVIGPLSKAKVSLLAESPNVSIPTLALNYTDQGAMSLDLYQFGLRGEDEAKQAALFAWQQGYREALSLTASTSWGRRINQAFTEEWRNLGGKLNYSQQFGDDDFSNSISQLLAVDDSEARYKQLRTFLGEKSEFTPRRRQDADFIFLSALAKDARQLKPILAFHYAANLPVIATSHVYTGDTLTKKDEDLNGILFSTTPWALQYDRPIRANLEAYRQNTSSRFGRLYALGADAYRLAPYLNQLQSVPGAFMSGNTGKLAIDNQGIINRTLVWAKFSHGEASQIEIEK